MVGNMTMTYGWVALMVIYGIAFILVKRAIK